MSCFIDEKDVIMRKDVKLGALAGVFIIVLSLWYFGDSGQTDQAVPLSGTTTDRSLVGDPSESPIASTSGPMTTGSRRAGPSRPAAPIRSNNDDQTVTNRVMSSDMSDSKQSISGGTEHSRSSSITSSASTYPLSNVDEDSTTSGDYRSNSGSSSYLSSSSSPAGTSSETYGPLNDDSDDSASYATNSNPQDGSRAATRSSSIPSFPFGERISRSALRSGSSRAASRQEDDDTHTVVSGDTFTSIALDHYGSERLIKPLIAANPQIKDPNLLVIGMKIKLPPKESLGAETINDAVVASPIESSRSISGRSYTVQPGDTLYGIAREALSSGDRWREIFQLNKDEIGGDPSMLKVGQVLALPKDNPS
jgi:nucleoid-associated protein YgaU